MSWATLYTRRLQPESLAYLLDKPITSAQYELIKAKRKELAVDVYLHVPAFESEEYNTFEAIRQAVDKEMGRRGTYNGLEFIAQSVAMVYNGDGAHPIADAVSAVSERKAEVRLCHLWTLILPTCLPEVILFCRTIQFIST